MTRFVLIAIMSAAIPLAAQTAKPAAKASKGYTAPKTPWGDPDLQGEWPATANIPMQRPANFGTRAYLTDEEFAQRQKQAQTQSEADSEEFAPSKGGATDVSINPPSYWQERGRPD